MGADLLSIGRSGLNVSKKQLETTSHNIANANTEGYSRQRATAKTSTPLNEGSYVIGTGSDIKNIKRFHDKLVEKKLQSSVSQHGYNEERTFQLGKIEEVFNEVNSEGVNKILNRFFNSFRELSNQPENETVRNIVRENARIVVKDFKRVRETLDGIRDSIDYKLDAQVTDVNTTMQTIADLNKEISRLEISDMAETGDLRDQRDLAVKTLSESFKIKTYEDDKGQFVVSADGAGSLVAGGIVSELIATRKSDKGSGDRGTVDIYFKGSMSKPISSKIQKGKLGAALKTRNEELTHLEKQMDNLAYGLVKSTNAIHRRGIKNVQFPEDQDGNPIATPSMGKITGINFFKEPTTSFRASETIELSDDVKNDLNNIATGMTPNSPGDNRISIAISKLQHEKILEGGTTTLEEQYLKSVGNIGLATSKAKIDSQQSVGILAQANSIRERISGVSLDEETANLVKYQHAYDASARVIRASDEMFKAVLGIMR